MSRRLLFLPGMMCDERLFAAQLDAFGPGGARGADGAIADVRCARFDRDDSIGGMARTALDTYADAAAAPLVVIGLSMGGIVAMECLRAHPEQVAAVVLMDTNPLAEAPERQRLRDVQIERALGGELERLLIDEMKPLYLAPVNQGDEALLGLVLRMARELGPDVFARQSRALRARRDYTETLAACTVPTLVLHGAHDTLCPPERHALMHALVPGSSLVAIPDAGHLPTLEAAEAVSESLARFLAMLASSST